MIFLRVTSLEFQYQNVADALLYILPVVSKVWGTF